MESLGKNQDPDREKLGRSTSFSSSGSEQIGDHYSHQRPETLQQKMTKTSRKLDNHLFLPGFLSFTPSSPQLDRLDRSERQIVEEPFSLDLEDDLQSVISGDKIKIHEKLENSDNDTEELPGFVSFKPSTVQFERLERLESPEKQNFLKEPFSLDLEDDVQSVILGDKIQIQKKQENPENDAEELSPVVVTLSDTEAELEALIFREQTSNFKTSNRNSFG